MCPLYDFLCACGNQRELLVAASDINDPMPCDLCAGVMARQFPKTHRQPDGLYSHDPNIGNADTFDRRWEETREQRRKR